nr:MAG TPA: hypothetical protein [Caudoviricetes sp.]
MRIIEDLVCPSSGIYHFIQSRVPREPVISAPLNIALNRLSYPCPKPSLLILPF